MKQPMSTDTDAGSPFDRQMARIAVGAYDDAQQVRAAMMNRIRDVVRKRNEGIPFDEVEEEIPEEERDYEAKYKDDNLPELIEEMRESGDLNDEEFGYLRKMLEAGQAAQAVENQYRDVMEITRAEPIFYEWLQNVYGVSTTLTARLIHRFGYCEEFDKVSNLWSYSGLAPGQERKRGEQLGYDPKAKTLAWLVADRIIMQGENSRYKREFYDPYKEKQLQRMKQVEDIDWAVYEVERNGHTDPATFIVADSPQDLDVQSGIVTDPSDDRYVGKLLFHGTPPESRGHADNRARRYLAKKFLKHYWYIARDLQGLDTPDEWVLTHGDHDKRTDTFENPAHAKQVLG